MNSLALAGVLWSWASYGGEAGAAWGPVEPPVGGRQVLHTPALSVLPAASPAVLLGLFSLLAFASLSLV